MKKYSDHVRIAKLLAESVSGDFPEGRREELAGLLEKYGLDNGEALQRIIHNSVPLSDSVTEQEAGEKVLANLRRQIALRRSGTKRNRPLRRIAVTAASVAVIVAGYFMVHNYLANKNDTILPLANQTSIEYPSGRNMIVAETATNVAELVHNDISLPVTEDNIYKIKVPHGTSHTLTLEDGTAVYLYPGSELRFPVPFDGAQRRVELTGEGYFDVARDESRPFRVFADGAQVKVLGTSFNVKAYNDDPTVETALVSGSVEVNGVTLTPDQMAVFSREAGSVELRPANGSIYRERSLGMFIFENQTLDEIMHDLSLWFDFEYSYTDTALGEKSFRFRLPHTEDFNRLTELITLTGEVEFRITGKHVEILPGKNNRKRQRNDPRPAALISQSNSKLTNLN